MGQSFLQRTKAEIDDLLSALHPIGRFKAAFFGSLGYTSDHADELAHDLQTHIAVRDLCRTA